jgi:hypothetical protein
MEESGRADDTVLQQQPSPRGTANPAFCLRKPGSGQAIEWRAADWEELSDRSAADRAGPRNVERFPHATDCVS